MTTPLDQTRAEFEAHRLEKTGHVPLTWERIYKGNKREMPAEKAGLYFSEIDQAAWEAWQAAIASRAAPEMPAMPETWHVVAHVHGEPILSIGYDWLSGKELDEAEEQAVIGMAQHLLAFVGYGLPPSTFSPDDESDAADAARWRYAMDWNTKQFAVCMRDGMSWTPIKTEGPLDHAMEQAAKETT